METIRSARSLSARAFDAWTKTARVDAAAMEATVRATATPVLWRLRNFDAT
jgi:hypothetical protein